MKRASLTLRQSLLVTFAAYLGTAGLVAPAHASQADNSGRPTWNQASDSKPSWGRSPGVAQPVPSKNTRQTPRSQPGTQLASLESRRPTSAASSSKPAWNLNAERTERPNSAQAPRAPLRPSPPTNTSKLGQSQTGAPRWASLEPTTTRRASVVTSPRSKPNWNTPATQVAQAQTVRVPIPTAQRYVPYNTPGLPPEQTAQSAPRQLQVDNRRINVWGREVTVVVPVRELDKTYGTVPVRIAVDDVMSVPAESFVSLLGDGLTQEARAAILASATPSGQVRLDQLPKEILIASYNSAAGEIVVARGGSARPVSDLSLNEFQEPDYQETQRPAAIAAYITNRAAVAWEHLGNQQGFGGIDTNTVASINVKGLVLEAEANGRFRPDEQRVAGADELVRASTRIVFDQQAESRRWLAGDISTKPTGYLGAPQLLGIQVARRKDVFDPNRRNLRPTSFETFSVSEMSDVDIVVNGQVQRRVTLEPGQYRLTDFPFINGGNEVQVIATDRTGRQETQRFNRFFEFSLLAPKELEYEFSAGVLAQTGLNGPTYENEMWVASGHYRYGFSNNLTAGAGLQVDSSSRVGTLEGVLANRVGTMSFATGLSHDDRVGGGAAGRFTFQRQYARQATARRISNWSVGAEAFSGNFAGIGQDTPQVNATQWRAFGAVNFDLSPRQFANLNVDASQDRLTDETRYGARLSMGFRLNNDFFLSVLGSYETSDSNRQKLGVGLSFSRRLGRDTFATANYDTIERRYDAGLTRAVNTAAGASALSTRIAGDDAGLAWTSLATRQLNRANVGFDNTTQFDFDTGNATASRSSVQLATSLAFADGWLAVGRPISDSFAIIAPHKSLGRTQIEIDRNEDRFAARTDAFGPALLSDLSSYSSRAFTLSTPDAILGTDLGEDAIRLKPTYRSGFTLTAGSEYIMTALGRAVDVNGRPLALVSGEAALIGADDGHTVPFFTNSRGQFGITGLKPGRWTLRLSGNSPSSFTITIPSGPERLVQLGDVGAGT